MPVNTPVAGASFRIGAANVVVERFRARVGAPEGVNIRSAPEVKPDNRVGSVAPGAIVEVEGRVPAGQEAEAGKGTTWYFLGTVGATPQFIYGAPGTIQPLDGAATPPTTGTAPAAPASVTAAPAVTSLPSLTPAPTP